MIQTQDTYHKTHTIRMQEELSRIVQRSNVKSLFSQKISQNAKISCNTLVQLQRGPDRNQNSNVHKVETTVKLFGTVNLVFFFRITGVYMIVHLYKVISDIWHFQNHVFTCKSLEIHQLLCKLLMTWHWSIFPFPLTRLL